MRLSIRTLRPDDIRALTGLSGTQLGELVSRRWARHPDHHLGRPWALGFPDRVLLDSVHWRTNLQVRQLAALFSVSKSAYDRVLSDLAPHVAANARVASRAWWHYGTTLRQVGRERVLEIETTASTQAGSCSLVRP